MRTFTKEERINLAKALRTLSDKLLEMSKKPFSYRSHKEMKYGEWEE